MNSENSRVNNSSGIEERKLNLEEKKLALESSFARKWLPAMATAVVSLIAVMFGFIQNEANRMVTEHAQDDAKLKNEREWGIKVVEMYFQQHDRFDLSKNPEQAVANLKVLVAVAPDAVKGVLSAEQSRLPAPSDDTNEANRLASLAAIAEVQAAIVPSNTQKLSVQPLQPSQFVVYIQYPEGRREMALQVQTALQQIGYKAPGIEKVSKVPSRLQVRYYRPEQKELAVKLAEAMGATLNLPATADNAIQVTSQKQLPSGILELWLPPL